MYKTTKEGLKNLVTELKQRENDLREKIKQALNEARNQGDLRENDGYSLAIEEQQANEARIAELKEKIDNAEIVESSKNCDIKDCKVNIGNTVTLDGEKEVKYEITGEEEANPLEGKISYISPIGSAILGKKVGDEVKIKTPSGIAKYKISKVE